MRTKAQKLRDDTGWGAVSISKQIKANLLPGHELATVGRITVIINPSKTKTVDENLYYSILEVYGSLEDNQLNCDSFAKDPKRVRLDHDFIANLTLLTMRHAQLGMPKFLKHHQAPKGVTNTMVNRIQAGKQDSLKKEHFDFFQQCFEMLKTTVKVKP